MDTRERPQPPPRPPQPRSRRARGIAVVGLLELALLALLVVALAGNRFATTGEWLAAAPGGHWAVAGIAFLLLVIAAFAMTLLLSE